jgi:chromosome segregation ATPase
MESESFAAELERLARAHREKFQAQVLLADGHNRHERQMNDMRVVLVRLLASEERIDGRLEQLSNTCFNLAAQQFKLGERVDKLGERVDSLVTAVEDLKDQQKATDDRINALIAVVDGLINKNGMLRPRMLLDSCLEPIQVLG